MILTISGVQAQTTIEDDNRTVDHLGVQVTNAYFSVVEGFSVNCQYGNVYFAITSDGGKVSYANILAAKLSGRKLTRLQYSQPSSGGLCTLSLVEFEN